MGKGLLKIKTQPNSQSHRISKQEVPVNGLWLFPTLFGNPLRNATDHIILSVQLTGWGRDLRFICIGLAHHPRLFTVSFTSILKIHRHMKVCEYGLKKSPYKLVSEIHSLSFAISPTFLNFSLPLLTGNIRLSPENTAFPVAISDNDWFFFQI